MPYRIKILETAQRELRRLPGNMRQRARRVIYALAQEPRPRGARELRDRPGYFRVRLDDWRIIYQVNEDDQTATVVRVQQKSGPETYEDLQ